MSSDRIRTPDVECLLQGLLELHTADEAFGFLEDLCTVRELQDMAQRFSVARMLADGKHYSDIEAATGASSTTISRVNRCLQYGDGGYAIVLDRFGDQTGA